MKSIFGFIFFILAAGQIWAGPGIKIVPDSIFFGTVPRESNFYAKIVLKSTGTAPLRIDSIQTICPCIKIPFNKGILSPGDSIILPISYNSESNIGQRNRFPHFYTNASDKPALLGVLSFVVSEPENLYPLCVRPYRISASQFGKKEVKNFTFYIVNKSGENMPLKLLYWDNEYYMVDFPSYVPPRDSVRGMIKLNNRGVANEFENSLTFEYINELDERKTYSIPIVRKRFNVEPEAQTK